MAAINYSVLDLATVIQGHTIADSFNYSVANAQQAEALGYTRYWFAEHHNMVSVASSATSLLIGHIAGKTSTIRVGSEAQAFDLLDHSLKEYFEALKVYPQRLVLHKTSNFNSNEIEGFKEAAYKNNIHAVDMVTIMRSDLRLYRETMYPPLRGTMASFDDKTHLLYTRGFVPFYNTYPGSYIPSPIEIRLFSHDESPELICDEILALSKMNWNNTQFDRKFSITIECSRKVGEILKYLDSDETPQIKYSFYM